MQSNKKRVLLAGASIVSIAAILAATFFFKTAATQAAAPNPYQVTIGALKNAHPQFASLGAKGPEAKKAHPQNSTCVAGLDTITNFCGQYTVAGVDSHGAANSTWFYNMVGNAPQQTGPGTTTFDAPIIPVAIQLLNADGTVALTYDPLQFVRPVLNSPVFSTTKYSSGPKPTQFTDALQRAEFFNQAKNSWHTMLDPRVKTERTMKIPAGSYQFALNADGSCCLFVLVDSGVFQNLLFPPNFPVDNTTVIGAAELAGDITTKDISTFLFPNTFLYIGDPSNCCIIGFHSFDFEPGVPSNGGLPRAYVVQYASWISPGIFGGGFEDITALSHEMSETFNDPFVTQFNNLDVTPWWLSGGNCQNDLETGDVVEGLANPTVAITTHGYTYHPQTEAMLQWFESSGTSNAIDGAYSYPNESVLTTSNISQNLNCTPPITG
ncbi:MAG: hypothetical protein ACHQ4H_17475 [Ktedonobacterales bacterium]